MDRGVLDVVEREIDQQVRARFPGTAVRRAVLLQYGDDPGIEPGDLLVRVLLDEPDGPDDDWGPAMTAFEQANEMAIEQFAGYLAAKLREIMAVEWVFSDTVTWDGEGPRGGMPVAQRLSDISEWEHGEATFVLVALGSAGLETVDMLIMAGIAATRAEAMRWAVDRAREGPAYQRLRDLKGDAELMDRDVLDTIERDINEEVRARFPGTAVRQAVLLHYSDDPEIGPGDLWVRVLLGKPNGPQDYWPALMAFRIANYPAIEQFAGYLAEKLPAIRLVEYTFSNPNPVTRDGHAPRLSNLVGERPSDIEEREHGEWPALARLGPAGLDTLDTLIMAGTVVTRAAAIRWAVDRIRERPAYQRLRELRREADTLKNEF